MNKAVYSNKLTDIIKNLKHVQDTEKRLKACIKRETDALNKILANSASIDTTEALVAEILRRVRDDLLTSKIN